MQSLNCYLSNVDDNIIKSEKDSRTYIGTELKNGMKILFISDPSTDKSAAALSVQIGHMSDPHYLPGLAHFCEHMLFLGTKKYPCENDYNKFLHEHGGSNNAFTAADNACYYFDVAPDSLKGALDRFAQFFLCPLFTESATERELNAVDSEHEKNRQMDTWRLMQLEKATSNPKHDFCKFGTGNFETLSTIPKSEGINIREELLKFHEQFYSSNVMALAVYGKESIDDLMEMVIPLFSDVVNKQVKIPEWKDHPCDNDHLKLQGYVVPVKDIRNLNISFPIPDLISEYRTSPGGYLGHLLGHEGPGSILSELKVRGWANSLVAGVKEGCKGFAFFIVDISLTEEGIENTDEIVSLVFQYLKMLKSQGPQEWIFNELKQLRSMGFLFKDTEKPIQYVSLLSSRMFHYPINEVLCAPCYILDQYKPELIANLLDLLQPDKIRIAVVGKKFESVCNLIEKWYGTKYHIKSIEEDTLNLWKSAAVHQNLKLPQPNEFIPSDLQLIAKDPDNLKNPALIKNTKTVRLWFKQDDQFNLPKATLTFGIESPMAFVDPIHFNMCHIFIQLVKDSLNEYTYAAELAGLSYNICNTKQGITLSIKGYNDKQSIFLQKIVEKLTNLHIDENRFQILKEELKRGLMNFTAEQPHRHALYYTSMLLAERSWTNDELLNCIEEVSSESIKQMIPRFFSRIHIEGLFYGNLNKKQALDLMEVVEGIFQRNMKSKFLVPSQMTREREIHLSDGFHYLYEVTNDVHNSSAVETYFQCGVQETRTNMLLELLSEVISEQCYNYLRTQEQLGYIVCSGVRRSSGAQGLRILVQSEKPPPFVDSKIESFIQHFDRYIQELSDEDFLNHVKSLSMLRLEKPKKLAVQTTKYWLEISTRQYNFDRDSIEVDCLATITREDLYAFFKELIACDAPKRKKLSVHVLSTSCKTSSGEGQNNYPCMLEETEENCSLIPPPPAFRPPVKIENVTNFKSSLGLYPLVPPWIQISSPFFNFAEKSKL